MRPFFGLIRLGAVILSVLLLCSGCTIRTDAELQALIDEAQAAAEAMPEEPSVEEISVEETEAE